jgi:hypothetical protein
MFTYLSAYSVLICNEHQHAVYGLDEHLKRHHSLPIARRRELLTAYAGLAINTPREVALPTPNSAPITELGQAQGAFFCCQQREQEEEEEEEEEAIGVVQQRRICGYITTNRQKMRKHTNQQHSVKLTRWSSTAAILFEEHAAQLWKTVKVQTFFLERRYIRYFVVQEEEAQEEQQPGDQQQSGQQKGKQQQGEQQQGDQ